MILETTNLEDESNEFENELVKSGKFKASRWLVDCKSMVGRLQVDGWSIASLGRATRNFGADDARVWRLGTRSETPATSDCDRRTCGNMQTVKLDVETNDNIVNKKMWTS